MPSPVDPPTQPGQLWQTGPGLFEPGVYTCEGYADGYDETTAYWNIYGPLGVSRAYSRDAIYLGTEGTPASQTITVVGGQSDDTIVLRWGTPPVVPRTAYLPWNVSTTDMQNNLDLLISAINPLSPDPPPNSCTVTGTAGATYHISYLDDTPAALAVDFQQSVGSTGYVTVSTSAGTAGTSPGLDVFQICIRNSDFVFETFGFLPWTKVRSGAKDTFVRTSGGWVPITRLPERFSVQSHRWYNDITLWFRNRVAGQGDFRGLNTETMRTLTSDNYWLDIGDFAATDGVVNLLGQFYYQPNVAGPVVFPTSWPSALSAPGRREQGVFTVSGFTSTADGSDPAGLAAAEIAGTGAGSSWRSAWAYNETTSEYVLTTQRDYSYAAMMVDHDWVLWLKDRFCRSGATAYYYVELFLSASFGSVGADGVEIGVDLHGYSAHLNECTPAVIQDFTTQSDFDGSLPITTTFASGVVGASRGTVPIEGDVIYTSKFAPTSETTFNTLAFAFPFTPTTGGISGLYLTVDQIPDGLVTAPSLDPHADNGHLPLHAALIEADIARAGVTFSQPGEPVPDWQFVKWKNLPAFDGDWLLDSVTVLP